MRQTINFHQTLVGWRLSENAIRPKAIAKKNWLLVGDVDARERSAIVYTIIESFRRRGLDPYAYLREILTRLPNVTTGKSPKLFGGLG